MTKFALEVPLERGGSASSLYCTDNLSNQFPAAEKKRLRLRWPALLLAILFVCPLLSSCQDEGWDSPEGAEHKTTVKLPRLVAQIDEEGLKAMGFSMEANKLSQIVPVGQFQNGKEYDVHTIISNGGGYGFATLKWTYHTSWTDETDGTVYTNALVMNQGQDITITNEPAFDNAVPDVFGWHIRGVLGGTLDPQTGQVKITPQRSLQGVDRTALPGKSFNLEVPFAFPWTPLSINTSTKIGENRAISFKPLGSLIGYEIGNSIGSGVSFTPAGFTVYSNAFRDEGYFNLVPQRPIIGGYYPEWGAKSECFGTDPTATMSYTFASSTPAGTLADGTLSNNRYYAWVMPTAGIAQANTTILMNGSFVGTPPASRFGLWAAAYSAPTTGRRGVPEEGKTYTLKARLKGAYTFKMPMEAITEYNLAGGAGTYAYPQLAGGAAIPGLSGDLRFANRDANNPATATVTNPHANNGSGYYNWYILNGVVGTRSTLNNVDYNPNAKDLKTAQLYDVDGQQVPLKNKYYIPEQDDWWGIFPGPQVSGTYGNTMNWGASSSNASVTREALRVGGPDLPLRFTTSSSYADAVTEHGNQVVYALRFLKAAPGTWRYYAKWYNPNTNTPDITVCFPRAENNLLASLYKYTHIRGSHIEIEAIHLGEAGYAALLASVGSVTPTGAQLQSWWSTNAGLSPYSVVKRTFASAGAYRPNMTSPPMTTSGGRILPGIQGYYWSNDLVNTASARMSTWTTSAAAGVTNWTLGSGAYAPNQGFPVRLFER